MPAVYNPMQEYRQNVRLFAVMQRELNRDVLLSDRPRALSGKTLKAARTVFWKAKSSVCAVAASYGYCLSKGSSRRTACEPWAEDNGRTDLLPPYELFQAAYAVLERTCSEIDILLSRKFRWARNKDLLYAHACEARLRLEILSFALFAFHPEGAFVLRKAPDQDEFLARPTAEPYQMFVQDPRVACVYLLKMHADAMRNKLATARVANALAVEHLEDATSNVPFDVPDEQGRIKLNTQAWLDSAEGVFVTTQSGPKYNPERHWKDLVRHA